jgi:hypothetical protein
MTEEEKFNDALQNMTHKLSDVTPEDRNKLQALLHQAEHGAPDKRFAEEEFWDEWVKIENVEKDRAKSDFVDTVASLVKESYKEGLLYKKSRFLGKWNMRFVVVE